ncbi:MAG: hypothetical protein JWL98_1586 [Xanthomonadaceae bacterium]|jgi:hypothetical protein|nr:hypothetical protein [Xanthomonadaceae bacterium]
MLQNAAFAHYAILTAMLAPAFFLTATASLLMSANTRLARIIDRTRVLLKELAAIDDPVESDLLDRRIAMQRRRTSMVMRGSQCLYLALSFFVATSLTVAADSLVGYRLGATPTVLAVFGVLSMFAASVLLARESALAVELVNEEMDHAHARARRRA